MPLGQSPHLENSALDHSESVLNMERDAGRERLSVTVPGKGQCVQQVAPSTGTTIKNTWTKSRGRVEAGEGGRFGWGEEEGWGENADNCNRITIKKTWKTASSGHMKMGSRGVQTEP